VRPVYIFCESYVQLENTLSVLEQNHQQEKPSTVIIIGNHDLLKLFENLRQTRYGSLLDIIYMPTWEHRRLNHIKNLLGEKRYLKAVFRQHFKDVRGATIYFFCRVYTRYTFYILKRLRTCNTLIYVDDRDYEKIDLTEVRTDSLIMLLRKLKLRFTCGKGIRLVRFIYGEIASYIEDSFMAMVNQHITYAERKQWLERFSLADISFVDEENFALVFYDTADIFIQPNLSGKEEYCEKMQEIFSVLVKYFDNNQVLIKHHPAYEETMDLSAYGRIVPAFIPGEALQREGILLLGIFSKCVYESQVGRLVSLVNLFNFKDQKVKDALRKSMLERAARDVLFPETLQDLEKIIQKSRE